MSTPGADYWQHLYGLSSFEQFQAVVEPLWFNSGPLSGFLDPSVSQRLAYENPFSAHGLYANSLVAGWSITGGDVPKTRAAGQSQLDYITSGASAGASISLGAALPLIIPNTYLCAIEATSGGQDVINVIGVKGASSGQEQQAAAAVLAAWKVAAGPLAQRPSQYVMKQVRAMDLSTTNGGIALVPDTTPGSRTAMLLATNAACALVKWNGGTRSRSSRGRLYHGPLTENDTNSDGRTIATAYTTALVTAYNNMRTSLANAGFPLVIISRKMAQTFDVSSVAVESVIATQRRRIRG